MIGSRDSEWLQNYMNILVGLFLQCCLGANVAKSRTMTYQPGAIRSGMYVDEKALKCRSVGYFIPLEIPPTDPLTGMWSWNHRRVNDGTLSTHVRVGTSNILKPSAGKSEGAPPTGIWCEIPIGNKAVPLPLPRMFGVISYVEWIALAL